MRPEVKRVDGCSVRKEPKRGPKVQSDGKSLIWLISFFLSYSVVLSSFSDNREMTLRILPTLQSNVRSLWYCINIHTSCTQQHSRTS
ncbi:hypothetical protein BDV38DRAFT_264218 [Aspergillus pseudotamarii]|uniref:Uncharacterized protein n=1 Tax=Aspergillus pseudotamarii TaxID=132259 RepID=A0A5N6SDP1_ASPPS|nr:uncharacterized protein BDV38DRAFT_264218 [Aspergillus pseudotamarii]KAE8131523.1 hypothetical protein BDV38DRAFT_264218 [Aspergillus pseudotamarii]